jgi:hypothetical protein
MKGPQGVVFRRLHFDPITLPDAIVELQAPRGVALRRSPLRRIGDGSEPDTRGNGLVAWGQSSDAHRVRRMTTPIADLLIEWHDGRLTRLFV